MACDLLITTDMPPVPASRDRRLLFQVKQGGDEQQRQLPGQGRVDRGHAAPLAGARQASRDARNSDRRQRGQRGET